MTTDQTQDAVQAALFLAGQEITTTGCRQCGSEVAGVNGRYACGVCGWTNHWSEGHGELPTADQDVDAEAHAKQAGRAAGRRGKGGQ